ncbi:MAG: TAXI family TRAP transporter solute-binding subunit [Coriobacteriales bacterium]
MKLKKFLAAAVATAAAACLALSLAGCGGSNNNSGNGGSAAPVSESLRFVTGGESGTYYAFGTVLANYAANNEGIDITALSGNGSQANVQALQDGDAELAFCQSDVLAYAYEGSNLFEGAAYSDFSIVAALYNEQVQIVTCDPSIKTVADLKGKTVSIGAAGSGVYFNALDILGAYDLTEDDIDAVYQDFADSADSLKDGKIDAAFIVAGAPTTAITDLSTSKTAYLVALDEEHVNKLLAASPYYAADTIKAGTYKGQEADVTTVAVQAVVIANDSVSEDAVYSFVKSIFDGAEAQADAHAKYAELSLECASGITSVPYHAGAAKYFAEQGIEVATK